MLRIGWVACRVREKIQPSKSFSSKCWLNETGKAQLIKGKLAKNVEKKGTLPIYVHMSQSAYYSQKKKTLDNDLMLGCRRCPATQH